MFVFYNGNYYLGLLLNWLINREFRSGCPAKAVTIGANLITISNEHNHNPDQHGLTCELIEREVINRCREVCFAEVKWAEIRNGTLEDNDAARKKVSMEIRTKKLELMKNFSMEKIGEFVEGMMIYV